MSKHCEDFENDLLDLLYDELPPGKAEAVKTHLAACTACAEIFEQYQLTRSMAAIAEPPSVPTGLDASILAAAKAQCQASLEAVPAVVRSRQKARFREGLVQSLRKILLKPAFATVAVAGVVLLVTVLFVKQMGPSDRTEGNVSTLLEKAPLGPVVNMPSAKEQAESEELPRPQQAIPATAPPPSPPKTKQREIAAKNETKKKREGRPAPIPPAPTERSAAASEENASLERERRERGGASKRDSALFGALASPPPTEDLQAPNASSRAFAPAPKRASAEASAVKSVNGDVYQQGMAAFKRGDCQSAASAFQAVLQAPSQYPGKRAPAMHHLARCEKRQGRCSNAMTWYDNLISDHPGYSGMPSALWEASQCCQRLGRIGRAKELLKMLSTIPEWENRARSQLDKM